MACIITPDIAREYPNTDVAIFYSTPAFINAGATEADVQNQINGYFLAMERIGQSSSAVPTQDALEEPYSCVLRQLTSNNRLYNAGAGEVFIESLSFNLFDQMVNSGAQTEPVSGNLYQDANLNAQVVASQSNAVNRNVTSTYRFGMAGNWQPNFFRPFVSINGEVIVDLSSTKNKVNNANHLGDLSVGVTVPFCVEPMKPIQNKLQNIVVAAFALQIITGGSVGVRNLQRFGVHCEIKFRTRN